MIRAIKLGLAPLALLVASLFMAAPAWADYTGGCAGVPSSVTGNVIISQTSACTITHDVTATGYISIMAEGGVTAEGLTTTGSGSNITVGVLYGSGGVSTHAVSATGNIQISSGLPESMNLTISGTVKSTGSGSITLSSPGNLTVTGAISTTSNFISIEPHGVLDLEAAVSTSNNYITIFSNSGGITTHAITNSNGYVSLSSASTIDVEGTITTSDNYIKLTTTGSGSYIKTEDIEGTDSNITLQTTGSGAYIQTEEITDTTGFVFIDSADLVKVTDAITTTSAPGSPGHVYITAASTLETQAISTSLGGAIDLKAQTSTGTSLFTIGGSDNTNGTGKLTITGTVPSGDPQTNYSAWLYVTNGPTGSTAGIKLASVDDLSVSVGGGDRNGTIILNAQNGTLSMPAGTLSVAGTGGLGGGQINLLAETVTFAGTAELNASQAGTTGYNEQVNISAAAINYTGALTLNANGTGDDESNLSSAGLYSQGAFTVADNYTGDITTLTILISPSGAATSALSVAGSGNLSITANGGNYTQINLTAYPIDITGATVLIQSQGTNYHGIEINNLNGTTTGNPGLSFAGSGTVTLDASATAGATGGFIVIEIDQAALSAPTFVINANGPSSGDGDGGYLYFTSSTLTLGSSSKATITANAASAGTGNAETGDAPPAIYIAPSAASTIKLGAGNGEFSLSAQGGNTGGNAGSVAVDNPNGSIEFDSTGTGGSLAAINVSVPGPTGNGGEVTLISGPLTFEGTASAITANGGAMDSGNGGNITLTSTSSITIGTGTTGNVTVSAQAPS